MANGISVHIGLNRLDSGHYGEIPVLRSCVNDATAMAQLAQTQGFEPVLLLDSDATAETLKDALAHATRALSNDGLLLVTFSGYGSYVQNDAESDDSQPEEAWCLYDRQFLDDELVRLWAMLPAGARLLLISDTGHSGSVIRRGRQRKNSVGDLIRSTAGVGSATTTIVRWRALSARIANDVYRTNRPLYSDLQQENREWNTQVKASALHLAAAQRWEAAVDGDDHGAFTAALLDVWNRGSFSGSYPDFHAAIYSKVGTFQSPRYEKLGTPSLAFEQQRPFTIEPPETAFPETIIAGLPESELIRLRLANARRVFGSDAELAEALGVDHVLLLRWRAGQGPDPKHQERIVALDAVVALLSTWLNPGSMPKWLNGVNAHLSNRRPLAVLRSGGLSEVIGAIEAEKAGGYA